MTKMAQQKQQGFTLIELMIVVAIIGILAAVALPAYQDYTARAKMSEVITFSASAKTAVSECIISTGDATNCASNEAVGLDENISSTYVSSVEVGEDGLITTTIQSINDDLQDKELTLTPDITNGTNIRWNCEIGDTTLNKYVPQNCRAGSGT